MSKIMGVNSIRIAALSVAMTVLTLAALPAVGQEETKNPAKAPKGVETLELEEVWRAGGYDDEEVLFGVITDIIADEDGNFYLLDSQLNEIQVYSPDGVYQRTIGREGEGPENFGRLSTCCCCPTATSGCCRPFPARSSA